MSDTVEGGNMTSDYDTLPPFDYDEPDYSDIDIIDSYQLASARIEELERFLRTKVLHFVGCMSGETGYIYRWQQELLKEIQDILAYDIASCTRS